MKVWEIVTSSCGLQWSKGCTAWKWHQRAWIHQRFFSVEVRSEGKCGVICWPCFVGQLWWLLMPFLGLMPAWQGLRPYLPGGQSSTGGGKALPSWQADVSEKGVRSHPPGTGGRPPTHCGVKARLLGVVLAMWLDLWDWMWFGAVVFFISTTAP